MGHPCNDTLQKDVFLKTDLVSLRLNLIKEELEELFDAIKQFDIIEIMDALADIRYVVVGTFLAFGIQCKDEMDKLENTSYDDCKMFSYNLFTYIKENNLQSENGKLVKFLDEHLIKYTTYYNLVKSSFELEDHDMLQYVLCRMCADMKKFTFSFGLDLDKIFDEVHRSNMTKVCSTEEEAKESVEQLKLTNKCKTAQYKKSKCNKYFLIYDEETGKVLKGLHFELPNIEKVIKSF
jgi:predicted HAD superfamily Cof-like phosphohydrolase